MLKFTLAGFSDADTNLFDLITQRFGSSTITEGRLDAEGNYLIRRKVCWPNGIVNYDGDIGSDSEWVAESPEAELWLMLNMPASAIVVEQSDNPPVF